MMTTARRISATRTTRLNCQCVEIFRAILAGTAVSLSDARAESAIFASTDDPSLAVASGGWPRVLVSANVCLSDSPGLS